MEYNDPKKFPDNSTLGRPGAPVSRREGPRKAKKSREFDREDQPPLFEDSFLNSLLRTFWREFVPDTKGWILNTIAEWWGVGSRYKRSSGGYRDYSTRPSGPIPMDRVDRESYRPSRRVDDEWNDFVYESKDEALDYLEELERCIDRNGVVSVPKFYQIIGYKGGNYAVERYGWKNLDSVKIYYDDREEGYKMRFPMPIVLDRRW